MSYPHRVIHLHRKKCHIMRERFKQQLSLGVIPIRDEKVINATSSPDSYTAFALKKNHK